MPHGQPAPSTVPADPPTQAAGLLQLMFEPRIASGALRVALVVGTVLNLINQGEKFWTHQSVNLWQVALNFAVPFCVSSYSAACHEARRMRGD